MNEVYAKPRRRRRRRRARPSRWRSCRPARSSRSRRSRSSTELPASPGRRGRQCGMKAIEDYVGSLGLDAYLVGGAVRDELLGAIEGRRLPRPRRRHRGAARGARAARARRGPRRRRPAGRGAALPARPRDPRARAGRDRVRAAAPRALDRAGPARLRDRRRPGRVGRGRPARRDFTVNAMARRLADGELVDPFGGRDDLEARRPAHGLAAQLRARTRSGSCAGCASSRSSASSPTRRRCAQMREEAACGAARLGRADRRRARRGRDGGAVEAAARRASRRRALRLARDTGVLVALLPEFEPAIGFDQESRYHDLTVDEHTFAVVQAAADARVSAAGAARGALPRPRQAARRRGAARDGRLHYYARPGYADGPRGGRRRARRAARCGSAYPNELRERVVADRPLPHVRPRQGGRAARAAAARALRRRARARPARPQGGRPAAARASRRAARPRTRLERLRASARSSSRSARARTGSPTSPSTAPT